MKKLLQLTLACAGVGIMWLSGTSCGTDYNATPNMPGMDTMKNYMRGDFTAMLDGVNFIADMKYVSDVTTDGVRNISITGEMHSFDKNPKYFQTITLTISDYKGPNTYPIQFGVAGIYTKTEEGTPTPYLAKYGDSIAAITITQDGSVMEGSFNLVVAPNGLGNDDNHTITNGVFKVPK